MFLYHFIQMSLDCRTAYSRIATFSNHAIKFTERLKRIERSLAFDDTASPTSVLSNSIEIYRILFHHILYYDNIIVVSIRSYHLLFYIKVYYIARLLSLLFLVFRMSVKSKMVALSERTYKELVPLGNLEDTFDTVIHRLIERERERIAKTQGSLAGPTESLATVPQRSGDRSDER